MIICTGLVHINCSWSKKSSMSESNGYMPFINHSKSLFFTSLLHDAISHSNSTRLINDSYFGQKHTFKPLNPLPVWKGVVHTVASVMHLATQSLSMFMRCYAKYQIIVIIRSLMVSHFTWQTFVMRHLSVKMENIEELHCSVGCQRSCNMLEETS